MVSTIGGGGDREDCFTLQLLICRALNSYFKFDVNLRGVDHFIYLLVWSGTESTITDATYQPIVSALVDR
jgi:hypothetical protein